MRYFLIVIATFGIFFSSVVMAQEIKVDYKGGVIIDSDLDGLTDEGEKQLYGTDHKKADSDSDGFLDGAEVLLGTDPLDNQSYLGSFDKEEINALIEKETPWAWYVSRAAGLLAFIFLWLTIFFGLAIRNPWLKKIVEPIYSFDFHSFMAVATIFWTLVHGASLIFDKFIGLDVKDVVIPYFSQNTLLDANQMALGIMAFYAMVVLTVTSYLRKYIKHWLWRILHFLNPAVFVFVVVHGYRIGTDMKNTYVAWTYLVLSGILGLLYIASLIFVVVGKLRKKSV